MYLYYLELLGSNNIPSFLDKYLQTPTITRLKKVGYFCGMDYASKDIYNFSEYISRYDHSLSVSLMTYKLTKDELSTLAALYHDVATPCFSHVIDYMNKDYAKQESTEEYTEYILKNDPYFIECLKEDKIKIEDIINFKNYTIVDNERPKLCADRLDGVILTSIGWTKNITKEDIFNIVKNIKIYKNEFNEKEIGFKDEKTAYKVLELSNSIDEYCHSKEDNYMMELLAKITKLAIDKGYIKYLELYYFNEEELFYCLKNINDIELQELINKFENIKKEDIENIELPYIKKRLIKPLVKRVRI